MEPIEYVRIVRRRWPVIAACVLIAIVAAWGTTPAKPGPTVQTYRATNTLIRSPQDQVAAVLSGSSSINSGPALAIVALLATTGEVPKRVADKLNVPGNPAVLAQRVQVTPDDKISTLRFTATDSDGKRAAEIANTFAAETTRYLTEQAQLNQEQLVDSTNKRLQGLQAQINGLNGAVAAGGPDGDVAKAKRDAVLRQYSQAFETSQQLTDQGPARSGLVTLEEASPIPVVQGGFQAPSSRKGRVLSAVGVALVLGFVIALLLERFDAKLRTQPAVEEAFGLPVVAEIPGLTRARRHRWEVAVSVRPRSEIAEAYRMLRTSVLLSASHMVPTTSTDANSGTTVPALGPPSGPPKVVLVTSTEPAEGKTTTVANLAACLAELGMSVLVLDCDVRRPQIHRYLGVPEGRGLADVDRPGARGANLKAVMQESSIAGVRVITSGTPVANPARFMTELRGLIRGARPLADVVLLDVPGMLTANDALDLLPEADGVVVVCRSGRITKEAAGRTSALLNRLAARVVGVVLVGTTSHRRGSYSAYSGARRHDDVPVAAVLGDDPAGTNGEGDLQPVGPAGPGGAAAQQAGPGLSRARRGHTRR